MQRLDKAFAADAMSTAFKLMSIYVVLSAQLAAVNVQHLHA